MTSSARGLALLLALLLLPAGSAFAHKLKVFASAEGRTITGYVYFPGGGRGKGLQVNFLSMDGAPLGKSTSDENGQFTYTATAAVDHRIVVDSNDGHVGEFVVRAAELDTTLPAEAPPAPDAATPPTPTAAEPPATAAAAQPSTNLEALVDAAVARHVRPLREQLEGYEEKVRMHDILGGIGYILGLLGLAVWFMNRRAA